MTEALNHYLDQCDKDFENQEEKMSRLSDDEKRFLTDQISMLKGENERLTKTVEQAELDHSAQEKVRELEAKNASLKEAAQDTIDQGYPTQKLYDVLSKGEDDASNTGKQ